MDEGTIWMHGIGGQMRRQVDGCEEGWMKGKEDSR